MYFLLGGIQFFVFELSKGKWTRDINKFVKERGQETRVTIWVLLFYNKAVRILFHLFSEQLMLYSEICPLEI